MIDTRRCRIGALALALLSASCGLQQDLASSRPAAPGRVSPSPAPAFSGRGVNGEDIDLGKRRGHVVLIDFWGSWCGPCRAEQPELTNLANKYSKLGVNFLGDDIRDDDPEAQAYIRTFKVPYPSVSDASGEKAAQFNVVAPPTIYIIDQQGQIRGRYLGTLTGISQLLDQLVQDRGIGGP